jgi:protein arginine phosphatase
VKILFVCTGNTCRSPLAEAILKQKASPKIHSVRSAGIFAANGENASDHAIAVLKEHTIEHLHRSKMLSKEDVEWATYIFTMTAMHKEHIISQIPQAADKTYTLKEFVYENSVNNLDVSDPFGGSLDIYRKTYSELKELIELMLEKL